MRPLAEASTETLVREIGRWKIISAVMLVTIVALGSFSAYLLRSMDRDYAGLIDQSVPVLNELRAVSNDALSAQRSLLAGLLAESPDRQALALVRLETFLAAGRKARMAVVNREIMQSSGSTFLGRMEKSGADYEAAVAQFLVLARSDRRAEAQAWRRERVKPALDLYLTQLENAAQFVENRSQKISDDYSDTARSRSAILFGVASLPLVIGSLVLMVVVVVIGGMILIFRRVGVDDAN